MSRLIDFTGKRFGKLVAIKQVGKNKSGYQLWLCKCDCGGESVVNYHNLKNNHTQSCGCLRRERTIEANTIHGLRKTRLYRIWHHMRERCYYPKEKRYAQYGGRGIIVCDEWKNDFQAFYAWAIANGYKEDLSIDRIDVNGNYEPSNCRWVSQKKQCNNTRRNHLITYKGKTQSLAEWCDELKLDYSKTSNRINMYHWSAERAFEIKENARYRYITYKGRTQTLKDWCLELGLKPKTVGARINRYGWTVERAFEEKVNVEYIRNTKINSNADKR
jgi:hypothetical protein